MKKNMADFLFEVSWEACNKSTSIHNVLTTKSTYIKKFYKNEYIVIGPDIWRDYSSNNSFEEDPTLFRSWTQKAREDGLIFKVGRCHLLNNHIIILVDFTQYFSSKNEIFKQWWDSYGLNSLNGNWEYIEPCLFGYAAGKIIESFFHYNLSINDKIIAHFQGWQSSSGILYLKDKLPSIGTVLTLHSTVIGHKYVRSNKDFYRFLEHETFDKLEVSQNLDVISEYSLENIAASNADILTAASPSTLLEVEKFIERDIDFITPNGVDNYLEDFKGHNNIEMKSKVASIINDKLDIEVDSNSTFIFIGGHYNFKNKGYDIFIDVMDKLREDTSHKITAFIITHTPNYGSDENYCCNYGLCTHHLSDLEEDPIMQKLLSLNFNNKKSKNLKIVFIPVYLDGKDGLLNMTYREMILSMDLGIFPSYYEPWGYSALETLSMSIPIITTNRSGIGARIYDKNFKIKNGIATLFRDDDNREQIISGVKSSIDDYLNLSVEEKEKAHQAARNVSNDFLWDSQIIYYQKSYEAVIRHIKQKKIPEDFLDQLLNSKNQDLLNQRNDVAPIWHRTYINLNPPKKLSALESIPRNLYWSWNKECKEVLKSIDIDLWEKSRRNPLVLLQNISHSKLIELASNQNFIFKLNSAYQQYQEYLNQPKSETYHYSIAYFSMEYGISDTLPIYSGGLGMLAGDHLKQSSDFGLHLTGVGLLYRFGYFDQTLSISGEQNEAYNAHSFSEMPIHPVIDEHGSWQEIELVLPGRTLYARLWKVYVGRVELILLDTDYSKNNLQDRSITHVLYGGDWENRFKQELLLGIGGIKALRKLNINADIYHCNEGHAAFMGLERLNEFITDKKLSFSEALEIVRASTLFTTHTPVPAGHDKFDENMMRKYMGHYSDKLHITWEEFMNLGRNNENYFSMSHLALSVAQESNGVSELHGQVSREMFSELWKGYYPEELFLGHVTNGVHYPTWISKPFSDLFDKYCSPVFAMNHLEKEKWQAIRDIPSKEIWDIKKYHKKRLIEYIKNQIRSSLIKRNESPKYINSVEERLQEDALTICFARRFATYKRASLLFSDLDHLDKIVNGKHPVQFIFAGKAHPSDHAGKDLIKKIINISKKEEFAGRVIFLENYNIYNAKLMLRGADIWLNTPTRPLEASGTSGMKAVLNGTLHFSVLDGWWAEGYKPGAGWSLPLERSYNNRELQDELDSQMLYNIMEDEIVPIYYEKNKEKFSDKWLDIIKNSLVKIAPLFTTSRMLHDYTDNYYYPLYKRFKKLSNNNFQKVKEIVSWKKRISRGWNSISVLELSLPQEGKDILQTGEIYKGRIVVKLNEINHEDIAIDFIIGNNNPDSKKRIIQKKQLELLNIKDGIATYEFSFLSPTPGAVDYGFRLYAKNNDIPHRQDFNFVKWL